MGGSGWIRLHMKIQPREYPGGVRRALKFMPSVQETNTLCKAGICQRWISVFSCSASQKTYIIFCSKLWLLISVTVTFLFSFTTLWGDSTSTVKHGSAFPIKELSFTGSGSLGSLIYSLQKNVLQFMSREKETPTLTVTGIMSFASQVAIEFVSRQSSFSEEGHKIWVSKYLSSQPVPLHLLQAGAQSWIK